ncbi:MAG: alpha,alpha-trehalose-phosphate synthase (UDP-forming) [Acidimicrobiales bacterium]
MSIPERRTDPTADLVVVANRLPIRRVASEDGGEPDWVVSPGGLVSALAPVLADRNRFAWVGWPGDADAPLEPFTHDGMRLVPVPMSTEEHSLHYEGMSNGTLWPLYHDKVEPAEFHRHWYDGYRRINRRFADEVARTAAEHATVWVHDYQLQLVPGYLRAQRPDLTIGFFLHIPFPPPELFQQIPWRAELTTGLLGADLIGFQTWEGAKNFARLATSLDLVETIADTVLSRDERTIHVSAFPIGIDVERYSAGANRPEITARASAVRERLGNPKAVLLGVDRLDYTKGIDVRLRAFKELLTEEHFAPGEVILVQVAEPSRDNVDAYVALRERVQGLVGEINGDFARVGLTPVHYIHQSRDFDELMSLYRSADVMMVTPLRDGMNLVAKEYVATRFDDTGVLVLSEFAGAAEELTEALIVNPYDIDGVKAALLEAVAMPRAEASQRMAAMRAKVEANHATRWAESFLDALRSITQRTPSGPSRRG